MGVIASGNFAGWGNDTLMNMFAGTTEFNVQLWGGHRDDADIVRRMVLMTQPGHIVSVKVHIGNAQGDNITCSFEKRAWNGTAWDSATLYDLFTTPTGESGWFCNDPNADDISSRSWAAHDYISIKISRDSSNAVLGPTGLTVGILAQIDEETQETTP